MNAKKLLALFSLLLFIALIGNQITNTSSDHASAQITPIDNPTNTGSMSLPDLFTKVEKSVVQVTEQDNSNELGSRLGSGFVFDKDGHIITNYHVVVPGSDNNDELQVSFLDGNVYSAELVGFDQFADLAVIKVKNITSDKLTPLSLANSTSLRIGETVVAIGNPFGLSGSMTVGIVSGLGRLLPSNENGENLGTTSSFSIPNIIQTDAAINPGNSGGPLIDTQGRVIGINTAIFSNTGVYSGVGFAIPSNTISKVVQSLIQTGSYRHPYIGIIGLSLTPDLAKQIGLTQTKGFLITSITKGSPAEKSDLRAGTTTKTLNGRDLDVGGDIILKIDNRDVTKIDDILSYLESQKHVGDKIHLTALRDNTIRELDLVLGERPSADKIDSSLNDFPNRLPPPQNGNGNSPEELYDECVRVAGKSFCDFLFRK
ncbi:MAG TPA: trypsin-like peptidase domain-containing protein [Nitrososphaeraceae archaeon]|nr:trypsin-like peptidase domain-containing protein [Nitrososphaeraceae archaeon]